MKVNAVELLGRLNKVSGVVSDKGVIEELRSFHFLPDAETGILKIAGTDGNMTLLQTMEFEATDSSDASLLVLSVGKLLDIIRYAGHEVEFVYSAEDNHEDGIKIVTPKSEIKLRRHFGLDEDLVNFDLDKETDFEDELTASELKGLLSSLSGVIDGSATDTASKTVFIRNEFAFAGDDISVSRVVTKSNASYEFLVREVRQMLNLLSSVDPGSTVYLKKTENGEKYVFKTDLDVLTFNVPDVYSPELEVIDEFTPKLAVMVSKEELTRGIQLVRSTSEDNTINFELSESVLNLTSFYLGEESADDVDVISAKLTDGVTKIKFDVSALDILKLLSIIPSENVVLSVDSDMQILHVREPQKQVISAISVNM